MERGDSLKVYVPDLQSFKCYTIYNKDTIRAYKELPSEGQETAYRDFFIHSDYYYKDGTELISEVPVCIDNDNLTDDVYYRVDLINILVIFLILCIFCFLIPLKVFLRFFRRFN